MEGVVTPVAVMNDDGGGGGGWKEGCCGLNLSRRCRRHSPDLADVGVAQICSLVADL
jgi:hypothetical protein